MMLFNKGEKIVIYMGSHFKEVIYGTVIEFEDPIYTIVTRRGSRVVTRGDNLKSRAKVKELCLEILSIERGKGRHVSD
jgi:hypothetical protein